MDNWQSGAAFTSLRTTTQPWRRATRPRLRAFESGRELRLFPAVSSRSRNFFGGQRVMNAEAKQRKVNWPQAIAEVALIMVGILGALAVDSGAGPLMRRRR